MEFDKAIQNRLSVRSFRNKEVSWKSILEAIDAANQGPYAGNINHLRYIIIENKHTIKKISEQAKQSWLTEAPLLIVVCSDDTNLENMYGERGRVYSRQQAGAAINTILLKLTDLGLSSCWVGAYTDEVIKSHLNIPAHIQIEAVIPVGYVKEKPKKPKKRELENTIYWEEWGKSKKPTNFEEPPIRTPYETIMNK